MTDASEAPEGHPLPLELPGPAPRPLTDAQIQAERKLCESVPLDRERQEALFEKVSDICTTIDALNLQAKQKGFQSIADSLRKLDTSDGVSLAARLRGILATIEKAKNGKATLNTLWKLELELVDAYDHLANFWPQVSAASDEEYQVEFGRLETLFETVIRQLCMLPSSKHVSRICLIFKPDVANTTRTSDVDTIFDVNYELPSTVTLMAREVTGKMEA